MILKQTTMKKSMLKFNVLALSTLFIFATLFTSCKEDPIVGCMDPDAENFDSAAEVESGDCSYARDKFIGSYTGMMECLGLLEVLDSEEFPFEVSESLTGGAGEVGILLTNLSVTLNGTVDGNVISIDSEIPAYPFDVNGDGTLVITADLLITGSAELNAAGTMLDGELNMEAKVTGTDTPLGTDTCLLTGTKN